MLFLFSRIQNQTFEKKRQNYKVELNSKKFAEKVTRITNYYTGCFVTCGTHFES